MFLALPFAAPPALAERAPVLKQIAVPHDYYFREMYLPQLTTGPSSATWSPDSQTLVYSMQGSLWRQALGSGVATQLTAGPGYDYQPDWSPDGERVVFVRYLDDAMELYVLELDSGEVKPLTDGGAVNLEPRWSPDGARLAFVSTRDTGRFHVFIGRIEGDTLTGAEPLVAERKSEVDRYYYSPFDHELSPSWSPDGDALLYVGNPEVPYGTGAIYRHPLDGGERSLVHDEETTWKARPDWSPDGKRIVYASYLGRQWHQLWTTTVEGSAYPFPLTYGDYDVVSPRWSPDGSKIAYIANEFGNTELRIQDTVGGAVETLEIAERRWLEPMGELALEIVDENGEPAAARVAVLASDGRAYAPADAWMKADDSLDRDIQQFETHYFHTDGKATVTLPAGEAKITVWRGLENAVETRAVDVEAGRTEALRVELQPFDLPKEWRDRQSADVHVHMNYGGTYRNTPAMMVAQAQAEDLDLVFNLIVNKEQRFPDIAYASPDPDPASNADVALLHSQEYHTSYWGHMGLLGLDDHILIPGYSAYPYTAAASLYPDNATAADLAHEQNAAVGYVHPFLAPPPDPATDESLTNALPVDAALGKLDYYEVVGFADHRASADVWYRLLNLGFGIAAAGGTDAMANYASLRGPVGINRTYVPVKADAADAAARRDAWIAGLKAGHTLATNAPLLGFTLDGRGAGNVIELDEGSHQLDYSGFMRSIVPIDHLEIVYNGEVVESIELDDRTSTDLEGTRTVDGSGWLLLRAWNEGSHPLVFDLYPYGTTSPVYVTVDGERPRSPEDAEYFIAWIERIRESAANHPDYNTPGERAAVLEHLDHAQRVYEEMAR